MVWANIGAAGLGALGNILSSRSQSKAAASAAAAQKAAIDAGMTFGQQQLDRSLGQQRSIFDDALGFNASTFGAAGALQGDQLDEMRAIFAPYLGAGDQAVSGFGQYAQAGLPALRGQQALAGTLGPEAQAAAIAEIENSPEFGALRRQGESSILAKASATGGLRGGNTQAALAQFSPALLSQQIRDKYAQLGGLAATGAQAFGQLGAFGQFGAGGQVAAGQAGVNAQTDLLQRLASNATGLFGQLGTTTAGLSSAFGSSILDLIGQRGAVNAGNAVAQGKADAGMWGTLGGIPAQALLLNAITGGQSFGGFPTTKPNVGGFTPEATLGAITAGWR